MKADGGACFSEPFADFPGDRRGQGQKDVACVRDRVRMQDGASHQHLAHTVCVLLDEKIEPHVQLARKPRGRYGRAEEPEPPARGPAPGKEVRLMPQCAEPIDALLPSVPGGKGILEGQIKRRL